MKRVTTIARIGVIDIDDRSDDLTMEGAFAAGADHVIDHAGNRGLAAAFNQGVTEALARGADIVVALAADGQHDPSAMPPVVALIVAGGADVVVAARPLDDASEGSPVRRAGNRIGSRIARGLLGVPLSDVTSGYRAFSREALVPVHMSSGLTYTVVTLIQAVGKRLRMTEATVPAHRRLVGTSRMRHSISRYVGRTADQAFRASLQANPLRVFGRPTPLLICGPRADGICSNRRLIEDPLGRIQWIGVVTPAWPSRPDVVWRKDARMVDMDRDRQLARS
jgi:hypothetical protein